MVIHSAYLVLNTVTPISDVKRSAGPGDGRYQSVMAHRVAGRTREIDIRMALGAQTGGVMRLVLAQRMDETYWLQTRACGSARRRSFAGEPAVRSKASRSNGVYRRAHRAALRRVRCELRARTPRHAHLSLDGAAIRITIALKSKSLRTDVDNSSHQ